MNRMLKRILLLTMLLAGVLAVGVAAQHRPGNPDGQTPPRLDIAGAAETLGITEEALLAALGLPAGGQEQMPRHAEDRRTAPDLAAVAETLGVTEEALKTALGDPQQGPPDLAAAAAQLGVAEEALTDALGVSGRPGNAPRPDDRPKLDIAGAAEALGVTEAELIAALRLPQGEPSIRRAP